MGFAAADEKTMRKAMVRLRDVLRAATKGALGSGYVPQKVR